MQCVDSLYNSASVLVSSALVASSRPEPAAGDKARALNRCADVGRRRVVLPPLPQPCSTSQVTRFNKIQNLRGCGPLRAAPFDPFVRRNSEAMFAATDESKDNVLRHVTDHRSPRPEIFLAKHTGHPPELPPMRTVQTKDDVHQRRFSGEPRRPA